jgi:pimeloyl-ACP methyl ester carboxylesterase
MSEATAGFRNAGWTSEGLPGDVKARVVPLRTADGAATNGFLYARGGEKTVVCIMHPREFIASHYLIPNILTAGCAAWTQASRMVGNDLRLEHEIVLLDVAAAMVFLRSIGFERIVLLGNSGGAGLYSFYNQQSLLAPEIRIAKTPGGRPTGLGKADMPAADGIILVSPHPGQGKLLQNCIDPSVVDELDPLSVDPALDFMDAANGFAEPPASSRYSAPFVARFRVAQRARVARLDKTARELIAQRMDARARGKETNARADRARGALQNIMTIWRTDADLRCWDLALEPSDRKYGSLWGRDPYASNYGSVGFARLCTPESWLSTWSGISSNASLEKAAPSIEQPTLIASYTGDVAVYASDLAAIVSAIPATDKTVEAFRGDHHGQPLVKGDPAGRDLAGARIGAWLAERFPVISNN